MLLDLRRWGLLATMLELRPNCELCDVDLPPAADNAMICTYECTFCVACVERLRNVCPNCGGGLTPRPIRPAHAHRKGLSVAHHPPSTTRVRSSLSAEAIDQFIEQLCKTSPSER